MSQKPRRWWIAGLLSLLWPGLGQVYNGEGRKGLLLLALPLFLLPAVMGCLIAESLVPLMCGLALLTVAFYAVVVSDAILAARRHGQDYQIKPYNKVLVYIGVILVMVVANSGLSAWIRNNYAQAFKIPAASMAPTLLVGDHILVDRRPAACNPNRGDLIVFKYPVDPNKDFIKRVVAVAGDTVEGRDKELQVNGTPVTEAYVIHKDPKTMDQRDNFGPVTVPPDCYFVMGDNRDQSYDSRFWGFVPKTEIKGTARSIYWSWDNENSAVRWSRIGTRLFQSTGNP